MIERSSFPVHDRARIVPNRFGGYSIEQTRRDGTTERVGNYATPTDAARICSMQFLAVENIDAEGNLIEAASTTPLLTSTVSHV